MGRGRGGRNDASPTDVIPLSVAALENPFAETAAVFVTRLVIAAAAAALSRTFPHLSGGAAAAAADRRADVAGRMDFLERSRRNARNESNQDGGGGNVGTSLTLSLTLRV